MMRTVLRTFLVACALTPLAPAQTVQLAEGTLLLATVEDADGEGLRVRRLDNGGLLELRWDQLSATAALAIKRKYDLAGDVENEVMARADEVEYLLGGQKQTIIGRIIHNNGDKEVVVQVRGVPYRIPRSEIRAVRKIEVPVGQIYTKDEWYALRRAELKDPSKADQHMLMAEDLIKVRDYAHAGEHLDKAAELGNTLDPARLESLTVRLSRYKEAAKEREMLDQIMACRSRGTLREFEKGVEFVANFESEFPQSRLKAEFDLEKKRFGDARERYYSQQIADYFRRSIRTIADKKVGEQGITLQAARDYAENQMSDDLFARAAQQYRVETDEAKALWSERARFTVGKRTEHFAYSVGSWVLGEKAVLKDTATQKSKDQQQTQEPKGNSRDIDRIARALKQALERRRAASQGGGGAQAEETEEDWWNGATRSERAGWLRAYYAEFGGQLEVTYASATPCVSCYGEGTTPEMGPDGKIIRAPCFLCHDTKWMRSFKAY